MDPSSCGVGMEVPEVQDGVCSEVKVEKKQKENVS